MLFRHKPSIQAKEKKNKSESGIMYEMVGYKLYVGTNSQDKPFKRRNRY